VWERLTVRFCPRFWRPAHAATAVPVGGSRRRRAHTLTHDGIKNENARVAKRDKNADNVVCAKCGRSNYYKKVATRLRP